MQHQAIMLQRMTIKGWLLQQSGNEDRYDGQRADVTDKEPEDTEKLCIAAEGASVGEFIINICLLEPPSDEEYGQQTAESHQYVGR